MKRTGRVSLLVVGALVAVLCLWGVAFGEDVSGDAQGGDVWQVKKDHPRIWLDEAKIAWLREKVAGKSVEEVARLAGPSATGCALVYQITGDRDIGRKAVEEALGRGRLSSRSAPDVAICYDWCYDLLSDEEKKTLQENLIAAVGRGVKKGRALRSFHNGLYTNGWQIGAVALALYGDHPFGEEALRYLQPEMEDGLEVFDKVYLDGGWGGGYAYNHHVVNAALRFFLALRTACEVDLISVSPHMRNDGYYMLYGVKPNGLVYPGDDNDWPALGRRQQEGLLMMNEVFRDPYYQYFLNHCPFERFGLLSTGLWQHLLWYDGDTPERPLDELPPSRIFRGDGLVIARSGWNWDPQGGASGERSGDTWVTFRCGDYLGDHNHLDNNHFEIYYKGELALDAGRYDPDWGVEMDREKLPKSQYFNYCRRAIAHNTMLVYDPDEKMHMGVVNDGGQMELLRVDGHRNTPTDYDQGTYPSSSGVGTTDYATHREKYETGDIVAYKATRDFTYVCGDATKAYSAHKMKSFVRHFLFVQPNIVIVFDRVVSTNADFKKTWLLHTVEEPVIAADGSSFEVTFEEGRLVCIPVVPEKRVLTNVGGPGNECLVGDHHYKYGVNTKTGEPDELHYREIPGAWRVEESPAEGALEDYFLNVMLMTDAGSDDVPLVSVLEDTDELVKVRVETPGGMCVFATFAKGEKPSVSLKLESAGEMVFGGGMADGVVLEEGRP